MPKLLNFTRRLLNSGRDGRRGGSILIMVIAVLVLLALMGTAYISTARIDRQAAPSLNDETPAEVVDTLLPAVEEMVKNAVLTDVYTDTGGLRPVGDTNY